MCLGSPSSGSPARAWGEVKTRGMVEVGRQRGGHLAPPLPSTASGWLLESAQEELPQPLGTGARAPSPTGPSAARCPSRASWALGFAQGLVSCCWAPLAGARCPPRRPAGTSGHGWEPPEAPLLLAKQPLLPGSSGSSGHGPAPPSCQALRVMAGAGGTQMPPHRPKLAGGSQRGQLKV